ncbi:lactate permease LctP family transporter [Granulicella sp. dw_53]|uniref:L-lactate permease n=1 Tax=Granulicella sp. dw_53 TaxID=2719792 RepID=UPI001C4A34C8|nr:lactate permease LctP family transporter [Granulicella sp. dw_53]
MTVVWPQPYYLFGQGLGVSAFLAMIPTLLLLYLLAVKRKPSWVAALSGLGATMLLVMLAYGMSVRHTFSAVAYGASFGVFPISWIVFWALVLYEITVRTAKFEVIKDSIGSITSDKRMQALLIAFAFGAFIEGCAGFGTPVAVAAAMMVGLGFSSLYASSICLLANTAPVAFGSIGIPVITLAGITGLSLERLSGMVGRLSAPISFFLPAYLILVTSGFPAMIEVWPAVLACGAVFATVQFCVSNFIGPQLTDILSSIAAMSALVILLRFWQPSNLEQHVRTSEEDVMAATDILPYEREPGSTGPHYTARQIWAAWMPYAFLVVLVLAWGYQPFLTILNKASISFAWPALHDEIVRMPPVVQAPTKYVAMFNFNWLSASGTSCMFASLLSAICCGMRPRELGAIILAVARKLIRPTITVASMLAMAFVMNYSGATGTLGLAFSASGVVFPFFSPIMGWLGVFLTGSDTSSNALFGNLQVVSATRLGFDPVLIAGANSVGGVMGKMISLQTIAVAAAATNMSVAEQSKLFRFTLRHSIFLAVAVGVEVMLYAYVFHVR